MQKLFLLVALFLTLAVTAVAQAPLDVCEVDASPCIRLGLRKGKLIFPNGSLSASGTTVTLGLAPSAIPLVLVGSSATAFTVAKAGTDYQLQVDTATASAVTGIKITGKAAAAGVDLAVISTGTDESVSITPKGAGTVTTPATFVLSAAGAGLRVKEGSNATLGTGVCNGTTEVTVTTTKVTATSRIFYSFQTVGGTPLGIVYTSARSAGVSFGFKCAATDTSTVAWWIIEPAP